MFSIGLLSCTLFSYCLRCLCFVIALYSGEIYLRPGIISHLILAILTNWLQIAKFKLRLNLLHSMFNNHHNYILYISISSC